MLKKYIEQHQSHLSQENKTNVYLGFHLYKDNLDEAAIAANLAKELGGGGHPKASGFSLSGITNKELIEIVSEGILKNVR